jgi:hypothetical protein
MKYLASIALVLLASPSIAQSPVPTAEHFLNALGKMDWAGAERLLAPKVFLKGEAGKPKYFSRADFIAAMQTGFAGSINLAKHACMSSTSDRVDCRFTDGREGRGLGVWQITVAHGQVATINIIQKQKHV